MRFAKLLCDKNCRYASAVVAKPSGTHTPSADKCEIISPNEAFFPPTMGTSFMPTFLSAITYCIFSPIVSPIVVLMVSNHVKYATLHFCIMEHKDAHIASSTTILETYGCRSFT